MDALPPAPTSGTTLDVVAKAQQSGRVARLVRGAVLAGAGASLSLAAHVVGGGALPRHAALLLPVALATAACSVASRREWSYARLLGALLAVQLFVHVLLWLTCGAEATSGPDSAASAAAAASARWSGSGWAMLGAHVLAALVAALVLRHFESLYWRCLERMRGLIAP